MLFDDALFASIDLEFTGFDPETEDILEVGLVLFKFSQGRVNVVERFDRVFKPKKEVHLKILALTGIGKSEIDSAPNFEDFRDILSEKLKNTVLVGHGVVMDVRFLEKFGVALPKERIDTLELAQWILPTYHSYNLENLAHSFVGQRNDFHRALADAESTAFLLEKLLAMFRGYGADIKNPVIDFVSRFSYYAWQDLLSMDGYIAEAPLNKALNLQPMVPDVVKTVKSDGGRAFVFLDGSKQDANQVAGYIEQHGGKSLLLLENEQMVIQMWKDYGFAVLLPSEKLFNVLAFEKNLDRNDLSAEEVLFLLKVVVWKSVNWQTYAPVDLNVSFFGHQYLYLVTGRVGALASSDSDKLCASFATMANIIDGSEFADRKVVCFDFVAFEQFLIDNDANRLSWGYLLSKIRAVYNPETGMGDRSYEKDVVLILGAVDLFFGIIAAVMRGYVSQNKYVSWDVLESVPFGFFNLKYAANNLANKLSGFAKKVGSNELNELSHLIESFFVDDFQRVKWVEYNDGYIILHNQPLLVSGLARKFFSAYAEVDFVNISRAESVFGFAISRIMGSNLVLDKIGYAKNLSESCLEIAPGVDLNISLLTLVKESPLPLAVVFNNTTDLKKFYDDNYLTLKEGAQVYAQIYAGGSTKILRNFGLRDNTILLVTSDFVIKNKNKKIAPHRVIVHGLPVFGSEHPYNQVLQRIWNNENVNGLSFERMRMVYQFEQLVEFVSNSNLDKISLYFDLNSEGVGIDYLTNLFKSLKFFSVIKS